MPRTNLSIRTAIIFSIAHDFIAYIGESSIQAIAKSKVQAVKATIEQLVESLEKNNDQETRLQLLDLVSEYFTSASSAMNLVTRQYASQPVTDKDYSAITMVVEGIRTYCKQNGIALTGNNPFAVMLRQLHLTLAKAGENKVMWQQMVLNAFETLVVSVRTAVRTQAFAGNEYEISFPEFMIAPAAFEGSEFAGNSSWTNQNETPVKSGVRTPALVGAGAQG